VAHRLAADESGWLIGERDPMSDALLLNILQLLLRHPEVVTQFVHERLADLVANFCLVRTDRFDVLLIKHDVGWTCR